MARSRPDSRRARRVLVATGVVIVAAQVAAGLALDAAPMKVRFPQGARVVEQARAVGSVPYVLLLGSSRFWDIDVKTIDETLADGAGGAHPPVVKGAVEAGDPVVADRLLAELLAAGSRPGLVVLEVSPETLARPSPWVAAHAIRFFTWRDVTAWAPEIVVGDRAARVVAARFAPIHLYRRELLTWMVGAKPPYMYAPRRQPSVSSAGGVPPRTVSTAAGPARDRDDPVAPNAATLRGLRQTRKWLRRYRVDGGAARALEDVLARCHDAGVRVALVGVPVSSWVRALYTPAIERAFRDHVDRSARRWEADFLDDRASVPDRFFRDHHHLTARGGVVFARLLGSEVIGPRCSSGR